MIPCLEPYLSIFLIWCERANEAGDPILIGGDKSSRWILRYIGLYYLLKLSQMQNSLDWFESSGHSYLVIDGYFWMHTNTGKVVNHWVILPARLKSPKTEGI